METFACTVETSDAKSAAQCLVAVDNHECRQAVPKHVQYIATGPGQRSYDLAQLQVPAWTSLCPRETVPTGFHPRCHRERVQAGLRQARAGAAAAANCGRDEGSLLESGRVTAPGVNLGEVHVWCVGNIIGRFGAAWRDTSSHWRGAACLEPGQRLNSPVYDHMFLGSLSGGTEGDVLPPGAGGAEGSRPDGGGKPRGSNCCVGGG